MLYEQLTKPPAPGTPMESLMLLVWRMRQDIRLTETRALIQAITFAGTDEPDQSSVNDLNEAWKEYTDEMFPFQRGRVKRQDEAAMDYLKQEVARGPLAVKPLQYLGKARSRLYKRASGTEAAKKLRRRYGVQ
jgi:hypothetical protein